jgi:hypothetical protein
MLLNDKLSDMVLHAKMQSPAKRLEFSRCSVPSNR